MNPRGRWHRPKIFEVISDRTADFSPWDSGESEKTKVAILFVGPHELIRVR